MSQSLRQFARFMTNKANGIPAHGSNVAVKVATAIVKDLIANTPVDTSKALSNWQIRLGGKGGARIDAYFYGKQGSTQDASGAAALATALLILKSKTPGQAIHIFNNLPYIRRLDEGSSTQQPAGFVARAELIGRKVAAKG